VNLFLIALANTGFPGAADESSAIHHAFCSTYPHFRPPRHKSFQPIHRPRVKSLARVGAVASRHP